MYDNMEHLLVRSPGGSPLDSLDRNFYLFEQPVLNLCNQVWIGAINDAVRMRRLSVLLTGQFGNMTLSYAGIEALPELLRSGRWVQWARLAKGMLRRRSTFE